MTRKDKIAVLGFGSQGKAIALNLRDSGYGVTVGLRPGSKSKGPVRNEKLNVTTIRDASARAKIIIVALPDHVHRDVLNEKFFENLSDSPALVFLHGASIHFGLVRPPRRLPVLLLAPHAPGLAVRENYKSKKPYSAFYSVFQGSKKEGYRTLRALGRAIGVSPPRLIKTSFAEEAVGDIFGEQAVLCGGLARLMKFGFETLVEKGISPANAYLEVAYQIDLIVDLIKSYGLSGMLDRISPLARYGSAANGPVVISDDVKRRMEKVFEGIESGRFMRRASRAGMKADRERLRRLTNLSFDRQARKFSEKRDD